MKQMKHISKIERKQLALLAQGKAEAADKILQFSKKRYKRFDEVIESLYNGENLSDYFQDRRIFKINEAFKNCSSKNGNRTKEILRIVFLHLRKYSLLLGNEDYIHAVYNIVYFNADWQKDIRQWKPTAKLGHVQLKQLSEFLFCKYKAPAFLYKAFFEEKNILFIEWFIHLGKGGKARDINKVSIPFTQKMAHYFIQAPEKFSVKEALRWAQVKGMGGNDNLAERVSYSWLADKPEGDEDFWNNFLLLLINGGMFNLNKVTELIDYVRYEKRREITYIFKGRTLASLTRQSDEWHRNFSHGQVNHYWKPSGLDGLRIERKQELLVLEELTEYKELAEEGRNMKHCVASYSFYCSNGRSAIFSLRKYVDGLLLERLATIEVSLTQKKIVQAKAKMNKAITDEARKYLTIWAEKEGLMTSVYL